ncbi:TPA: PA3496 family putative envelope integrity protein [Vibrio parahaemolyticus]
MSKASRVKKTDRRTNKKPSKAQAQEGLARRRIEQYHEDKALEEALGLSLSDIHDTEANSILNVSPR